MTHLKFERVGHGIYVLNGDHCVGRLKQRYSGEWAYCSLNADEPLSFDQLSEIYQFMQELKTMNPWEYKELEEYFKRVNNVHIDLRDEDCLEVLGKLGDSSVDKIVAEPSFLSNYSKADRFKDSKSVWEECARVLKQGGTLLVPVTEDIQYFVECLFSDVGLKVMTTLVFPSDAKGETITYVKGCKEE